MYTDRKYYSETLFVYMNNNYTYMTCYTSKTDGIVSKKCFEEKFDD